MPKHIEVPTELVHVMVTQWAASIAESVNTSPQRPLAAVLHPGDPFGRVISWLWETGQYDTVVDAVEFFIDALPLREPAVTISEVCDAWTFATVLDDGPDRIDLAHLVLARVGPDTFGPSPRKAWWNELEGRLRECSVQGPDVTAPERERPGWQDDVCVAAYSRLEAEGFIVRETLGPRDLDDDASSTGSPVVGGARIDIDAVSVTLVIRIDSAGEVYTRISDSSRPDELGRHA